MTNDFNGYKNYDTWNVALWINNDEGLYRGAVDFMKDANPLTDPSKGFVISCGLSTQSTPDGAEYMGDSLDYEQLDEMMRELL